MAAGKWKLYEQAKKHLADGTFDLDGNTFKITLHASSGNQDTLTTSSAFSDLTGELSTANGYTAGGITLSGVTWTNSGGTITFTFTAPVWTASGGSIVARSAVIRASGTLNSIVDPILCTCLLDSTPADVTTTTGNTLTITPSGSGAFTVSGAASN